MAEKPSPPAPPATLPPMSDSASAHAPFVYFDAAPTIGYTNGTLQVTLEAARLYPGPAGKTVCERVLVAHLRMNARAARSLRSALDKALLLAATPGSQSRN